MKILLAIACCFAMVKLSAQPNIVLIISDDHAYQAISAYGSTIMHTPGIDRIAREGAIFNKAYVANSICGPSRASILTGQYSHKNGFKDNRSTFNFNQNSFAKLLQKAGYQTAWIGKMHLGDSIPQGFDYYSILPGQGAYYNPDFLQTGNKRKRYEGYVTNVITNVAEEWLNTRDQQKPFCLVIGHKATHRTWMPDLEDLGRFDSVNFKLPETFNDNYATRKAAAVQDMSIAQTMRLGYDLKIYDHKDSSEGILSVKRMNERQREVYSAYYQKIKTELEQLHLEGAALTEWKYQRYMRDYLSTAASLDRNINRTLDLLDQKGLAKNTVVIYMSDQGFYLGEHGWFDKRFMYEPSFRTPMVMRYPGLIQPGTIINEPVMNIDLGPTFLDLAKAKSSSQMQGVSFLDLLKGQHRSTGQGIYYHYYENGEHSVSPHFGIKTERYKLIRFYDKVESWELFDLEKDPDEMNNIYGQKNAQLLVKQLKEKLLVLIKKYDDKEAELIFKTPV